MGTYWREGAQSRNEHDGTIMAEVSITFSVNGSWCCNRRLYRKTKPKHECLLANWTDGGNASINSTEPNRTEPSTETRREVELFKFGSSKLSPPRVIIVFKCPTQGYGFDGHCFCKKAKFSDLDFLVKLFFWVICLPRWSPYFLTPPY